jgi:hypothetical protein
MNHIVHSFTFLVILKVLKNIYFCILNWGRKGWADGGGCGSVSSDDAGAAADDDNICSVIIWPLSGPAKHIYFLLVPWTKTFPTSVLEDTQFICMFYMLNILVV